MTLLTEDAVAAVIGSPIAHSLSPVIHNAWIKAAGLAGCYEAAEPANFQEFLQGERCGSLQGVNVTAPFKAEALAGADVASARARMAGSANLLVFKRNGDVAADNTDGEGLLAAFEEQAPGFDPTLGPCVVLGAGGAARGAIAAFIRAGAPSIRVISRSIERASDLAAEFGCELFELAAARAALSDANAVINATPAAPDIPFDAAPSTAIAMDMVYRPIMTPFLAKAGARGLATVDGLAMLIGQARPSFRAFFGAEPPPIDVRALAISALAAQP